MPAILVPSLSIVTREKSHYGGRAIVFGMFRRPRTVIRIDVGIPPAEVEARLRGAIGPVRSFLLSPTWGRREDLIGQVKDGRFRARVRHGYSNGLTRLLYGRVTPQPSGSRVEGEFRTLWWVVLILRSASFLILFLISTYLLDLVRRGQTPSLPLVPGPILTLGFLAGIEAIARRMGDRDEERIRDLLSRLFADVSIGSIR